MNRHLNCLGAAQDHFEGRLDAAQEAAFEAHRAACPDCRRVLDRWEPQAPLPDFATPVLRALRGPRPGAARPIRTPARGWAWAAAAAFALALAVSAFWHPERQWALDEGAAPGALATAPAGGPPWGVE